VNVSTVYVELSSTNYKAAHATLQARETCQLQQCVSCSNAADTLRSDIKSMLHPRSTQQATASISKHHVRTGGSVAPRTLAQKYRPFYVNCIRSPYFTTLAYTGKCGHLHQPGTCDYKHAWPRWRTADTITVRAGHCMKFLPPYRDDATGKLVRPQLAPVKMSLRPQSTDHDVFLQVRDHHCSLASAMNLFNPALATAAARCVSALV
jgi:hypothetical protein